MGGCAPRPRTARRGDELVIKVLVALIVPGVDVHEVVQVHRRRLVEAMQRYTRLKADAPEDDVALALVADAELFRLEAIVRWLGGRRPPAALPAAGDQPGSAGARARRRGPPRGPGGGAPMSGPASILELHEVTKVYGEGDGGCGRSTTSTSWSAPVSWWR